MARGRAAGSRFIAGSFGFNVASGCYAIALAQELYRATGSVGAFTVVVLVEYLMPIVLGVPAGTLADRRNPALVGAWACFVPAAVLGLYLWPFGAAPFVGVLVGVVVNVVRPFYRSAIFAVGPLSVPAADLPRYNLAWTVAVQAGQILGGGLAGVVLWASSAAPAFAVAAVGFALAGSMLLSGARSTAREAPEGAGPRGAWLRIVRELVQSPRAFASVLLVGVDFLSISAFTVGLVPTVDAVFRSALWLGVLDGLFAAGAILGPAAWVRMVDRCETRTAITIGYLGQALGLGALALGSTGDRLPGQTAVCAGALLLGAGVAVSSSQQLSVLQAGARPEELGRIGSLRQAVIGLATVAGLPVIGFFIDITPAAGFLALVVVLLVAVGVNRVLQTRSTGAPALRP